MAYAPTDIAPPVPGASTLTGATEPGCLLKGVSPHVSSRRREINAKDHPLPKKILRVEWHDFNPLLAVHKRDGESLLFLALHKDLLVGMDRVLNVQERCPTLSTAMFGKSAEFNRMGKCNSGSRALISILYLAKPIHLVKIIIWQICVYPCCTSICQKDRFWPTTRSRRSSSFSSSTS